MVFTLEVGTDLFGTKHNTLLSFPHQPSVKELVAAVESYYDTKARAVRPAGYPDTAFKAESFQFFDEALVRWRDLENVSQMRSGQQLWCFQPESVWHSDAQGIIPKHDDNPVTWTTPIGSPCRHRQPQDAGVPPTLAEKVRSVFAQADQGGKGYLVYSDLERVFMVCDMEFTQATAGSLFTMADLDRSNHITFDEFLEFTMRCPNIVDALFFRLRDSGALASPGPQLVSCRAAKSPPPAAQQYSAFPPQPQPGPPAWLSHGAPPPGPPAGGSRCTPPPAHSPQPQQQLCQSPYAVPVVNHPPQWRSSPSGPPPEVVTVRKAGNDCDGDYRRTGATFNGMPIWVREGAGAPRLLYSTRTGHWMVSDDRRNFEQGCGWLTTARPHFSQWPHCCHGEWEQKAGDGRDERITVAMKVVSPGPAAPAPGSVHPAQQPATAYSPQPAPGAPAMYGAPHSVQYTPAPQQSLRQRPVASCRVESSASVLVNCTAVTEGGRTRYTVSDPSGETGYADMSQMPPIHRAAAEEASFRPQSVRTSYAVAADGRQHLYGSLAEMPPEHRQAAAEAEAASVRYHSTTA
eukprot:TRINITY_DN623_c0_g2_i1.p2 TRINITY_DN623_c0_g2~~TRINITY_DN623_c0_g2_i1.p2  ORF type:complete len:574 (+),score=186.53 TRINITY_DN623_c0_g2_i1:92-1813(+)